MGGVLKARPSRKMFLAVFVGRGMEMGIYFGSAPFHPLQHVRDLPEFAYLMSLNRNNWSRCLLWHGWLPGLGGAGESDPWATSFGDLACGELERCLSAYPVGCSGYWTPSEYWDADDIAFEMSDHPNIWTDGSRALVFICLLLKLLLSVRLGYRRRVW